MIVNKPQFDTENIQSGNAYWLKRYNYRRYFEINTPCIVKSVKPLTLVVSYFNKETGKFDELTIDVKSVVDGTFELTPMKTEEEK